MLVKRLHEKGHEVMIALLQDRKAVTHPDSWKNFLEFVMSRTADVVSLVEVCHAVNRMKWGVYSGKEQGMLLEPCVELARKYPEVKISGPSCIDFEYHHLYVDRRGAPENFQGKFSTVEKCALLSAIASYSDKCEDRVVISEVNWPLSGTGIWSPVNSTYLVPGREESELNVAEDAYGHFMLRYYMLSLCSGFVDQVFWWRLVSHGFGLVDERAEGGWRERSGYGMLAYFLQTLDQATFVEKLETEEGVFALRFERENDEVIVAWANGASAQVPDLLKESAQTVCDVFGQSSEGSLLTDSPQYFFA